MNLSLQKCKRHALREAVALCSHCRGYFCRECITEHDDKVICADCLSKIAVVSAKRSPVFRWVFRGAFAFVGFFLVWFSFYNLGKFLLAIPSAFHEGTLWTESLLRDASK